MKDMRNELIDFLYIYKNSMVFILQARQSCANA
jgi:hypothetical protein